LIAAKAPVIAVEAPRIAAQAPRIAARVLGIAVNVLVIATQALVIDASQVRTPARGLGVGAIGKEEFPDPIPVSTITDSFH
jgi:hypothetical protein